MEKKGCCTCLVQQPFGIQPNPEELFCRSGVHPVYNKIMYFFRPNVQDNAELLIHPGLCGMHSGFICGSKPVTAAALAFLLLMQ